MLFKKFWKHKINVARAGVKYTRKDVFPSLQKQKVWPVYQMSMSRGG